MDLGSLGAPAALWRRWVLLAAGHAALGSRQVEIRRRDGSARLESGDAWLRLRRLAGNRAVLWGHLPDLDHGERFRDDLLDAAPDWSFDIDSGYAAQEVGFLGWYAHGSWSSVPCPAPGVVLDLLSCLANDQATARWWRGHWPEAPDATDVDIGDLLEGTSLERSARARAVRQVELGAGWSTHQLSDAATSHLRSQIHAQMRAGVELDDRGLPSRPPLLRQWARVHVTGVPFQHAVCALSTSGRTTPGFVAATTDTGLDETQVRSLDNVLTELRMAETDEKCGVWMFARVTCDGRQVRLERAFDHWPSWYAVPTAARSLAGPTMEALHAEMEQRTPSWRPDWSTLLPERF